MLKGKRIFVSGGAGVIGQEMVPKLLAQGAQVFVGDLKACPPAWQGQVIYRQGDLNFLELAEIEDFAPEIFIHLAATFERSEESYEFWKENFWHNVRLSHHLMTLIKDLPSLQKVVFASSYLIYDPSLYNFDKPQDSPVQLSEQDPIYPRNLTGMAKLAHEIELRFIEQFRSRQYQIVLARIFRGYGRGSRDVISRWIRSLLSQDEITVFNQEGWFDYIYARDTAEGLIRLAVSAAAEGVVNLGTGKSRRVADVIEVLKKYFPEMKVREEKSDFRYEASQSGISRLSALTGWQPTYDLEKAIPEIIEFEKNKQSAPFAFIPGHILVSSASRKVPLLQAVKQAAAKLSPDIKVFAGDLDANAIASSAADEFWAMPKTEDANLESILAWCLKNGIRYIIPTRDGELLFWSKNRAAFSSQGINLMISEPDAVVRCLDKLEFSRYGLTNNMPVIPAYQSIELCPGPSYVVKERRGAGSVSLGINLDDTAAKNHAVNLDEPIFQTFVAGNEISADAYIDKQGKTRGLVIRRRDKVVHGESQITTTIKNDAIEKILVKAIGQLGLYGHVVLQAIIDSENQIHIIEANCRFGGASTLSIKAGMDSFYWFLLESSGQNLKDYPVRLAKRQIKQVRVPHDLYIYGPDF